MYGNDVRKKYKLTQMYMPFYAAYIAVAFGFVFLFLSFSSPYWLQSYDLVNSPFLNMGIWSVCFNRFVHPQIGIWQWLNPYWLIGVQVLATIAFTAKICVIVIMVLYHLLFGHPSVESTMALIGEIFIAVVLTICIFLFGISSQSRVWMQRPDQYFLSWSFGFLVLAAISSYISTGFLLCVSYTDRAAQKEVERYEAMEPKYAMASAFSMPTGTMSFLSGRTNSGTVLVKVPSSKDHPEQVIAVNSGLRQFNIPSQSDIFIKSAEEINAYN